MNKNKSLLTSILAASLLVTACSSTTASKTNTAAKDKVTLSDQAYSLILEGGNVWKGSGSAARVEDIGIVGDRIVAIGDLSGHAAAQRMDVSGLAVVPGFI